MRYINEKDIRKLGICWKDITEVINLAVGLLEGGDFSQPVKPYLRFKDLRNRIIAMPAYLGGDFDVAGIKWIASFPGNPKKGIVRAHSVLIINDADTGQPLAIFNTGLLSGIRTGGVSAYFIRAWLEVARSENSKLNFGIIGFGPIGQLHLQMIESLFQERIAKIFIYDIQKIDAELLNRKFGNSTVVVGDNWTEIFEQADVLITCTVSEKRYINISPRKGVLYVNVSLRDFQLEFMNDVDMMFVDNWEEVCRENTDIELAHKSFGLKRENVYEITQLNHKESLACMAGRSVMFNPMGMAIFDMAVARYYFDLAKNGPYGLEVE
jgi:2,3-diaminopropionate biosynthesis protein SbnB